MALRQTFTLFARRRPRLLAALAVALGLGQGLPAFAQAAETGVVLEGAGPRGAQIYCFMRGSGNSHQVSWDAAYAVIKRQSDQLFKTSPEHAAVMITEAVVQYSGSFPDCGRYLGDLFSKPEPAAVAPTPIPVSGATRSERFGY